MLKEKLKFLPKKAGIYLFKNNLNEIIYIGKAKSLKNRVSSYFKNKNQLDFKTSILMSEAVDFEFIETDNEEEALLLEAKIIQDKQPKFNLLLKDGQPFIYFLFTAENIPQIKLTRNKKEKGTYIGPFLKKKEIRMAYEFIVRDFKLKVCNKKMPNGCLDYHIGICSGTCTNNFNLSNHLFKIELIKKILTGKNEQISQDILNEISECNKKLDFERSKTLHDFSNKLDHILHIVKTHFHETKYSTDIALVSSTMSQEKINPNLVTIKFPEKLLMI